MQHLNNKSLPLKDDLKDLKDRERTLRSSSPAIKRPAADMGGQEREDDGRDVEMAEATDTASTSSTHTQSNNGKRQKSDLNTSNPGPVSQAASSEADSVSDSTLADTSNESRTSTAATSITGTADSETRPSIDEQIAKVTQLVQETPRDGAKGYCVSCKWMQRVLARSSEPQPGIPKSALEGEVGPVDNADIAMVIEGSGELRDEAGEPFTALRPGLELGEDYQVVPEEAWNLIVRWYGVAKESPIITRYAHILSEDNPLECQFELNPPVFSFLKVVGTQTPQTQKEAEHLPPRMVSSVHRPYMEWLKAAKEKLNIDINTKVRVWKVLGGIKSTSASGILTPAASRSASPAPGAEIIASAGTKMILDVNTFGLLTLGDQRELIDHKDHTMDANYNGKVDLRTIGLGRDEVIVLEEQTPDTDKFPSDNPKLSFKGAAKAKNLTVSGRSSPTPSIMTRGRAQREGRPKGIVGLQNLGNTCYMNSALQCIRSVEELTEYFRTGYYKKELNPSNPLGHHGKVAKAYGGFIEGIYSANSNVFNPRDLKNIVGKYGPSFAGYGQQDSQEFLAFLLDGLSEDLNRIQKKPYIEKPDSTDDMVNNDQLLKEFADRNWNDYKARNDSVIVDLFAGMYKSTLTCPTCDKVSIVFDPFSSLTLQLPIENNWSKEIIYFPLQEKPMRIDIDIDKNSSILDMKRFIGQRTQYDPDKMICAESYKNKFFKIFDNTDVIAETSISANDIICVYELAEKPTNYNADKKKKFTLFSNKDLDPKVDPDSPAAEHLLVPIYHRLAKANTNNRLVRSFFGHPSYVVLSREDRTSYDGVLKKVLTQVVGMTTLDILTDERELGNDSAPEDSDTLVVSDASTGSQSPSASGNSVQGEDGLVDVSMRDASQIPEQTSRSRESIMEHLLKPGTPIPKQLQRLFDIRVAHTEEGIPTGWNNLAESTDFDSLRQKAEETTRILAHHPRHSSDEVPESSADELAEEDSKELRKSPNSASESGGSPPQQESDVDSVELPEPSEMFGGKDTRGAKKHKAKNQKTYSRKGKKIVGKSHKRTPPPPPQPKPAVSNGAELLVPGDAIVLDWSEDIYEALFTGDAADTMRGSLTHRDPELFEDEELVKKRESRLNRKKTGVTLEDCLEEYGKTETLSEQNAWYCPRCKEHRRANKQFELWKVPDILVMHFKRFSSARNFRDKLELKVEYPVENLDLSQMVRDKSDGKSSIYDLIAVDNHYGGLGGGHYTAYAKNINNKMWYDYNDSHVSPVKDPEVVVQKNAYLLFYRRRSEDPLGGPNLEKILSEVDSEENLETQSRDASPSGEGQRLGGSSHNGSSSALVGQAHRVGDGGSAVNRQVIKMKGLSRGLEDEQEGHSMFHGPQSLSKSEELPPYGDRDSDMLLDNDVVDEGISMIGPTQPWLDDALVQGWGFDAAAPPNSNAGDSEHFEAPFGRLGRRDSNVSVANASSTGGLGGSEIANLSDLDDEQDTGNILEYDDLGRDPILRGNRESAPPPDDPETLPKIIHHVPIPEGEDDEELEVQELRIHNLQADCSLLSPEEKERKLDELITRMREATAKHFPLADAERLPVSLERKSVDKAYVRGLMINDFEERGASKMWAIKALEEVNWETFETAYHLLRKWRCLPSSCSPLQNEEPRWKQMHTALIRAGLLSHEAEEALVRTNYESVDLAYNYWTTSHVANSCDSNSVRSSDTSEETQLPSEERKSNMLKDLMLEGVPKDEAAEALASTNWTASDLALQSWIELDGEELRCRKRSIKNSAQADQDDGRNPWRFYSTRAGGTPHKLSPRQSLNGIAVNEMTNKRQSELLRQLMEVLSVTEAEAGQILVQSEADVVEEAITWYYAKQGNL
ncbi:hypothetical protein LTR64_002627 [Lithohypha guttulata]|uniref:uncharacterized protein n=1 Tax=Lithohypha guttulata TaxID=1690604 RepID=UPI002DDE14C2|nr:hypothetical protein LTR51_001148 [Lithohypha guttulata]